MSNNLKKLLGEIQYRTGNTIEQIAQEIGYTRAYFNNQINKGSNQKLKAALIKQYGNIIEQDVINASEKSADTQNEQAQILANLKEIREYARVIIAEQQAGQYYILSSLERLEGRQPGELSDLADKLAARLQEKLTFARKSIAENDSRISS